MGRRDGRKQTLRVKKARYGARPAARALIEGHRCKVRKENVTLDLCLVEQTRHPAECRGCWNMRG